MEYIVTVTQKLKLFTARQYCIILGCNRFSLIPQFQQTQCSRLLTRQAFGMLSSDATDRLIEKIRRRRSHEALGWRRLPVSGGN